MATETKIMDVFEDEDNMMNARTDGYILLASMFDGFKPTKELMDISIDHFPQTPYAVSVAFH